MELTQEHMDAYTLGATKDGVLDWSAREDRLGVIAVLNLIDPVPAEMMLITDNDGDEWQRGDDPMVWIFSEDCTLVRTAAGIEREYGIKEWSAE